MRSAAGSTASVVVSTICGCHARRDQVLNSRGQCGRTLAGQTTSTVLAPTRSAAVIACARLAEPHLVAQQGALAGRQEHGADLLVVAEVSHPCALPLAPGAPHRLRHGGLGRCPAAARDAADGPACLAQGEPLEANAAVAALPAVPAEAIDGPWGSRGAPARSSAITRCRCGSRG